VAAGRLASYSREQETQADELGAEYLSRTRYDPRSMIDVIEVLKDQERFAADRARADGRAVTANNSWLASHPSNDQRLADIRRVAAKYAIQSAGSDGDGRARYLRAIEGIPYGESSAQGLTRGQNFYHGDLGFALTAPSGWQVKNSAEAVTLVNGAGDAGLIVRLVPQQAGNTHEQIIRNLVKPTDGRIEKRSFNGLTATHFEGTRRDEQGQARGVVVSVVTGPGNRNYLLQYMASDAAALRRAGAQLRQAEASFRPLSAADRSEAQPWNLRTVPYPAGGFAELARRSPLAVQPEASLRLLNGVYFGGPALGVGTPVKVVR
jgi:predicted Zn-dependent protease